MIFGQNMVILAVRITCQLMLKSKNEAWRQQFRKQHHESIKRTLRDRQLLLTALDEQLSLFQKCSLSGAGRQDLDHTCYFHCEEFVGNTCHAFYRSIAAVGTQHCKALLLIRGLPGQLAIILEAVQNKTVINNELEMSRQCYSRLQLEEAITKVLCLFTEDEDLLKGFGDDAADLIFTALKFRDPHLSIEDGSLNFIHGLHNLFFYDDYKDKAYAQLRQNNFEALLWRHIMRIVDNRVVHSDLETSMLALARIYLRFQQEETDDQPHKMVETALGHLISHLFQPQNRQFLDGFDDVFKEELLKLIALFPFSKQGALTVLRCMQLAQYMPYAELFNEWTFNLDISIRDFSQMELGCFVGMEDVKEDDRPRYEKLIAGVIVNLLLNTADSPQAVAMVWRCLERDGRWEEWLDRDDHLCFEQLRSLLNRTPPVYSI